MIAIQLRRHIYEAKEDLLMQFTEQQRFSHTLMYFTYITLQPSADTLAQGGLHRLNLQPFIQLDIFNEAIQVNYLSQGHNSC